MAPPFAWVYCQKTVGCKTYAKPKKMKSLKKRGRRKAPECRKGGIRLEKPLNRRAISKCG